MWNKWDVVQMASTHRNNFPCAVVGIDIAGGEEWFEQPAALPSSAAGELPVEASVSVDLHSATVRALAEARRLGLNITLHAGFFF